MIILLLPVISIAACNCSQTNTKSVTKKEWRGRRDLLEDNAALVENNGLRDSDLLCLKERKKNSVGQIPRTGCFMETKGGVSLTLWPCHLHLKNCSILRQKKNYGNSNISPCQNIIFKKNPLKETKMLLKLRKPSSF